MSSSAHGDASGLTFSPDSRYLAWSEAGPDPLRHIKLAEVATGEISEVTPLRFVDDEPAFSTDGKYLAFLSTRTLDPLYDAFVFDLSFVAGVRPYLVPLAATTPSPFDAEPHGRPRHGAAEADGKAAHGPLPEERRRIGAGALGRVLDLAVSPDAAHAAVATHDGRVVLVRLDDGELRTVSSSSHGDASGLTFSPDSRYVAWSEAGPDPLRHIRLAEIAPGYPVFEITPA